MTSVQYLNDEALRKIQLFRHVDLDSVRGVIDSCMALSLKPGDVLLKPGDLNSTVYFITSGRLRVNLNSLDTAPIYIDAGDCVGEMSVIDHQPVSAYVVAEGACSLLAMNEEALWSLVRSSHPAACNLLYTLTQRLRHADTLVIENNLALDDVYEHYSNVDALTGLHSRFWMDSMLNRMCSRSITKGTPLSLIVIDIDNFTEFNEFHGAAHGDRILYYYSRAYTEHLRATEIIARYGDDEFIVILPEADIDVARKVAARLLNAVDDALPDTPEGAGVPHPTISLGIAQMRQDQSPVEFIAATHQALFRARASGGNRIEE